MKLSGSRPVISGWVCSLCLARSLPKVPSFGSIARKYATTKTKTRLPDGPARTRFAPSPTGNLHLGSIRTALFNYLLAKRTKGQFLLRIEDTDQKRTIRGAEDRLCRDLEWAGLQWDEGPSIGGIHGPYRQSERTPIYQAHVQPLFDSKYCYRCFCSPERIDELNRSRHSNGLPLGYDRRCADISEGESNDRAHQRQPHVIRFRAPVQYPRYNDLVYGKTGQGSAVGPKLHMDHPVYDDPVLIKSDGRPTYHFANVVDDHLMGITHVIRGSEWMSSTPLHIALYNAFGWEPPTIGHVPLLVDENHQKLSKRNLDTDISIFKVRGVFPEAFVNFAALLGWSHQHSSDVMNLQELESVFDLKFTKGNTIVSLAKLQFLQQNHARRYIAERGDKFEAMLQETIIEIQRLYTPQSVVGLLKGRRLGDVVASMLCASPNSYTSPNAFASQCSIFFDNLQPRKAYERVENSALVTFRTAAASLCLVPLERWTATVHRENLAAIHIPLAENEADRALQSKLWRKDFYHYLRWALLDGSSGPSIPETMEILGKDICTERIRLALLKTQEQETFATKPNLQLERAVA